MLIALEKDCRNQDAGFRNLSSIFIQAQKEEQRKELERQKNQTTKIDSNWNEEHKVRSSNTRQSKPQINLTHRELRNNKQSSILPYKNNDAQAQKKNENMFNKTNAFHQSLDKGTLNYAKVKNSKLSSQQKPSQPYNDYYSVKT